MKKNIHPPYHTIKVLLTNGEAFEVGSTWGKEGDTLELDIDPSSHVAWTQKQHVVEKGRLVQFNQRFKGLKF